MSARRRKLLGLAAAAVGTVAAGAVAGAFAEKRLVAARRQDSGDVERFGSLRGKPVSVIASDGVRLHAEVEEPAESGEGPTLVFVHGYALNLDCWHFQRKHYRGTHRVVFYDQRSHGRSDRSDKEHATIDQLGTDLRSVLDQLVPDGPVVLVGHSMGGMTIMALAEQHPELFGDRVVGAALISTTAGGLKTHALLGPLLPDRLMSQLTPRLVAGLARAPGLVDGARRAGSDLGYLATARLAFGDEVPASYVEFVDEMLAQTPFDVLAEFFPNFDALDKYAVLDAFARIATLVLCGDRDRLTSIGLSRKMASLIDGAELVECPGAGHMVILERREQVNAALDAMIEQAAGHDAARTAS